MFIDLSVSAATAAASVTAAVEASASVTAAMTAAVLNVCFGDMGAEEDIVFDIEMGAVSRGIFGCTCRGFEFIFMLYSEINS